MSAQLAAFKRRTRRKPLAACVAAIFALSAPAAVHAATYFVTNCDDTGPNAGTLRLAAANAVGGDTIDMTGLSAAAAGCNSAVNGFASWMTVNSTVTVAGGVTINGPGKNAFAVSALVAGGGPAFASAGALTINDLGVKYGNRYAAAGQYGGCINVSGDLTLTNVKTLECSASANTGVARGGAVFSFGGSVTATGSSFINSYVQSTSGVARGGAIFASQNVTLIDSTITCHDYGGGCTTTSAKSGTNNAKGGAVMAYSGHVYASSSHIYGNAVVTGASGAALGGAIYANTYATLKNSSVVSGVASTQSTGNAFGGGIYAKTGVSLYSFSIVDGSVAYSKGFEKGRGGGLFCSTGQIQVKYSVVDFNSAQRGGGLYSQGGVWTKYSQIFGNYATNGGGGIINKTAGNTTIQGSFIGSNGGQGYSGVDHWAGGATAVTIENSTISGNTTIGGANAAGYIRAYTTKVDNSTIVYNQGHGTVASAAGLYVGAGNAGSTIELASTLMSGNTNDSGNDDLFVAGGVGGVTFTGSSSKNLIKNPGGGVPGDTIVGQCPLLHPIAFGGMWQFVYRPTMSSPAIDAGANPLNLTSDERGNAYLATFPPRASGPGPANPTPVPDIGAYEVNQDDIIFDSIFETCQ